MKLEALEELVSGGSGLRFRSEKRMEKFPEEQQAAFYLKMLRGWLVVSIDLSGKCLVSRLFLRKHFQAAGATRCMDRGFQRSLLIKM